MLIQFKSDRSADRGGLGGWMGQTNMGLLPRRPQFMSCAKPSQW